MVFTANPGTTNKTDNSSVLKTFITKFLSDDFFVDMINIGLYPAELGVVNTGTSNTTIENIKDFLNDLSKQSRILKLGNNKTIQTNINLIQSIFTIRESGSSLISHDNVFQHLTPQDLNSQKLIKVAIDNRLDDIHDFRKKTDEIIGKVGHFYEISEISSTLVAFGNFNSHASGKDVTIYEALKNYKDLVIGMYNDLSKLQSINKAEAIKDYFIIKDKESSNSLADTLFNYVSKGYTSFKTGFEIFDQNIEGFESSSVHIISAPSNHGKSLYMINLCNTMIKHNINDFQEDDAVLFITLEDKYICPLCQ